MKQHVAKAPETALPPLGRSRGWEEDPAWRAIREQASSVVKDEPLIASFVQSTVLRHARLEDALGHILAHKLATDALRAPELRNLFDEAMSGDPEIGRAVRADLAAVRERDPACQGLLQPLLFFKGFQSIQAHRIAHWLWQEQRSTTALLLQSRASEVFATDIHPAARFGRGIMIDHGTGVVIGETAVVEDEVSMLQDVTLGGTGKEKGDRHPKIRRGVLIGAGARILGNIEIGEGAKIGAGSVVLIPVPAHCSAAGVPARLLGDCGSRHPAREMDHAIRGA